MQPYFAVIYKIIIFNFCDCWYEMFCEIYFVNCSWPGGHGDYHKHKDITHHTDVGTISFYYVNVILY